MVANCFDVLSLGTLQWLLYIVGGLGLGTFDVDRIAKFELRLPKKFDVREQELETL